MSRRRIAQEKLAQVQVSGSSQDKIQALADFSTHVNLDSVLSLIRHRFEEDNIEGLDEVLDVLQVLVESHRKAHRPGQSAPRHQFLGRVESGRGQIVEPIRILTDRFNLWIYPDPPPNPDQVQVQVETEAR